MLLTLYLLILAALTLFCIRLHRRTAPPLALYLAATATVFTAAAAALLAAILFPDTVRHVTLSTATPEGVYVDTTYVVMTGPQQVALWAVVLVPVTLVWVQTRLRALYMPSLVRWLFWPIFAGTVLAPPITAVWISATMPSAFDEYAAHMSRVATAYKVTVSLAILTMGVLVLQTCGVVYRRIVLKDPPSTPPPR